MSINAVIALFILFVVVALVAHGSWRGQEAKKSQKRILERRGLKQDMERGSHPFSGRST
jgi:hypothetical protein